MPELQVPKLRLLVLLEAETVTGPAKNMIEFCRLSRGPENSPAIETVFATFARGNGNSGSPVDAGNEFIEAARAAKIPVHVITERFPFDPTVLGNLRKLVACVAPDIIQSHSVKSHFLVRLSGVWKGRAWVAFHHGYTADARRMRAYNQLDRWSLRAPPYIITVCEAFKRQLAERGAEGSRIQVIHNAVPLDWSDTSAANTPRPGSVRARSAGGLEERLLLAVGRLSHEKAFADLILAMDHLRHLRPDLAVKLVILGEGPEKAHLMRLKDSLELGERVALVGHVRDVRFYFQSADAVVISSVSEGSPNALLEAMAAGIPVVATRVGGIPEIVTDKQSALLVDPGKPAELASALNLLLSDPDLANTLARNARQLARDKYSPQCRTRRLLDFYQQVYKECCSLSPDGGAN